MSAELPWDGKLSSLRPATRLGHGFCVPVAPFLPSGRGLPRRDVPESARNGHDTQSEIQIGNPPSGRKKSELPDRVLIISRNRRRRLGHESKTEKRPWKCACN